jgi:hypothetical protein
MSSNIDINFDFHSDTPPNRDPDSHSPTLRKYHKILWSKTLPNGELFKLVDTKPKAYLYHESNLGEFYLSSDAITHSYRDTKRMAHVINQVPSEKVDSLFSHGSTIGAYIVFPSNRINSQMTINQARGVCAKIKDRFDLTLECIRLFYENIESPLSSVFHRYMEFFNLFCDFKGYVDFFLLQDLVSTNYSSVKYHLQHTDFEESPLPQDINDYLEYRENTIKFIIARGQRMLASASACSYINT